MNGQINVSLANEVQRNIQEQAKELSHAVIVSLMGPNGEAAGDAQMSRGDRIARFIEDAQSGALDALKVMSNDPTFGRPTIYERYVQEFVDDIAHSALVAPPVTQPFISDVFGG